MAEDGRRYPPNLRGLLAFCTESTRSEDAPNSSSAVELDEERRKWLSDAIEAMQGVDPVKVMLQDIQILLNKDAEEEDIESKEQALEDLQSHTEDLDLANDFHKIGGFSLLHALLHSPHSGIRWRTADLIATLTQNNPYCQQEILDIQLLPVLLKITDNASEDNLVRIKALYALSCLTRESDVCQNEFTKHDGFSVLLRAMQTDVDKLQTKAAFMMGSLCIQQAQFKSLLCDMGMVEQLVGLLSLEHRGFHEQLFMALYNIVIDNDRAINECLRPEFKLKALLQERMNLLQGKEEYQDELEHVRQLYGVCFANERDELTSADR